MKKSGIITAVVIVALTVAGFFVMKSDPQKIGEETENQSSQAAASSTSSGHAGEASSLARITLDPEAPILKRLKLAKAGPGSILQEIELPGEIVLDADKVAHIVPRFAGIVQSVSKDLGDPVRSGEVLAVIQSNQSVSPYEVKSLVPGTIIDKRVTLGEFVRDDADIYVVADLSKVWVRINIYSKFLPQIKRGLRVRISANGIDESIEGVIDYVGPMVGEQTRTGTARVILSNPHGIWQPGLFVTARIETSKEKVSLSVSDDAIQTIDDKPVVFVKEGDSFEVRPLQIGRTDGKTVEVLGGLKLGEEFVAAESYIFKAEYGKGEAGKE